jgi:hypothetical protein
VTLDPHDAAQRGRIGGFSKAAKHPADTLTTAARRGFMARFEPSDPDLDQAERQRRTQAALRAHMAKLAYLSSKARGRRTKDDSEHH